MTDKQKHLLSLGLVLIMIGLSIVMIFPIEKSAKLGLDLRGGLQVTYEAKDSPEVKVTEERMEQAEFVLNQRVNALGVAEPEIQREGARNIVVQLPGVKDPERAKEILGKAAVLEFAIVQDAYAAINDMAELNKQKLEGKPVLGPVELTGDTISSAQATFGGEIGAQPIVNMTFNNEGAVKFGQITANNVDKRLAIVLDDQIITAPNIRGAIPDGKAVIEGIGSIDEAKEIAIVLNSGSIPVTLEILEYRRVGATLGAEALRAGVIAGIAGYLFVALYLLFYYQGLGLITWLGITTYAILFWGVVAAMGQFYGWTLTLPGIAGLILSLGIAADSKIIIFERIKEEVREGKTFRTAADSGFWHGFKTSLDADLVTMLVMFVVFLVGVSQIRGFALALIIGLALDIVLMLLFTRPTLGLLAQIWPIKSPNLLVRVGKVRQNA
ncbi:MAG: protein translocase subunit SecD [Actinobacteria bacterium]|nr:protein translocase subunit SecD [Actinomycetota bacterium]